MTAGRKGKAVADYLMEQDLAARGFRCIAGIDEAGRGPLAGPVAAAAVILDVENIPAGLADSKTLSEARRNDLFEQICRTASVSVAFASAGSIDRVNIRQASLDAMARAFNALSEAADFALVDGRDVPAGLIADARAVIGGDGTCVSIAAASIVAKVMRDRLMVRCAAFYPVFGFAGHKGYGTKAHRDAIATNGHCPLHRLSFAPMRIDDRGAPD